MPLVSHHVTPSQQNGSTVSGYDEEPRESFCSSLIGVDVAEAARVRRADSDCRQFASIVTAITNMPVSFAAQKHRS